MEYTIHIDPVVNCAFIKFYGDFEFSDGNEALNDIIKHSEYLAGMNVLRDFRDQRIPSDLTFSDLAKRSRHVINEYHSKIGKYRAATVVGDAQSFAKVHQFIAAGRLGKSEVERKAFRDIGKAMEWLDLPEGYEIKYTEPDEST